MITFRLFGHVTLEVDGRPFKLATPRKTLPLLSYLLLHRGQPIARDFLAYLFWPEESEESARGKLRANVYDLGRVLPPEAKELLDPGGDALSWKAGAATWVDTEAFESASADPAQYEAAIALYRGDLLATQYEEWIAPKRERYRNRYLGVLNSLVSTSRTQRRFGEAIAYGRQLLNEDPWREDAVARLIAVRYESGDRAGALAEYDRFAKSLRLELDIDPMPETIALRDTIVRGGAIAAEASLSAEPLHEESRHRAWGLPFTGRRAEMAQLLDAWARAARGRGGCIFVGGEAGIGKSRLIHEFAHAVEERGGRVLLGATGSPEAIPYQSFVEALRGALPLIAQLPLGSVWLSVLATLLPELDTIAPALQTPPSVDPANERVRLFEALVRCYTELGKPRPLALLLEDLHWADEGTIAALRFLLRRLGMLSVLVVVTSRDEETARSSPLQRLMRDAGSEGLARRIWLAPLTRDEVDELAKAVPPPTLPSHCDLLTASRGNPLFLRELIEGDATALELGDPAGMHGLLAKRIERLSPEARTVAEVAALMGARFSVDVVRGAIGWNESALAAAMSELADKRVVRETTGRGVFDYEFAHHVVADIVAEASPRNRIADRHRRIATVLEEIFPERLAELSGAIARHYDLGAVPDRAAEHYLRAAKRAGSLGALDEASVLLDGALRLAIGDHLRVPLLLERQAIEERSADHDAAAADLDALEAIGSSNGDIELRCEVAYRRAELGSRMSDLEGERTAIEVLRDLAQASGNERWLGAAYAAEARRKTRSGAFEEAQTAAERAIEAFTRAGDDTGLTEARLLLAQVQLSRGRFAAGTHLLDLARAAANAAGDMRLMMHVAAMSFRQHFNARDFHNMLASASDWLEKAIATGDRHNEGLAHDRLAVALAYLHHHAEARAHFVTAAAIFHEIGDKRGAASTKNNSALLDLRLGNFAASEQAFQDSALLSEDVADGTLKAAALANIALVKAYRGDYEGAKSAAVATIELLHNFDFLTEEASSLENLAFAEGSAGEFAVAIEHMERSIAMREAAGMEVWIPKSLGDLATWYLAIGDVASAKHCIERMMQKENTIEQATIWPQCCFWAAARVFQAVGDERASARAMERARAIVDEMSARLEEEDRHRYLSIPWNREILAACAGR